METGDAPSVLGLSIRQSDEHDSDISIVSRI
jgi:hypothetical protein